MLEELHRLPTWLKRAYDGEMPTVHQQCSHQAPESIAENRLVCALGQDVLTCPILLDFYAVWAEERSQRPKTGPLADKPSFYEERTEPDDAHLVAAQICTWHIFTSQFGSDERKRFIDTSEGYMQDESDRRFWANTYANLSMPDIAGEEEA